MRKVVLGLAFVIAAVAILTAPAAGQPEEGTSAAEETRACPGCGEEIPATAVFCPFCHRYIPEAGTRKAESAAATEPSDGEARARRLLAGRAKLGALVGSGMSNAGIWVLFGIRASERIVVGLASGYQNYPNGRSFPVCGAARASLTEGNTAPIVYAEVGYNVAKFDQSFTGGEDPSGPMVGAGGGLDVTGRGGVGFTAEAGARFESSKLFWRYLYPGGYLGPVMSREKTFTYFHVGAGVVF